MSPLSASTLAVWTLLQSQAVAAATQPASTVGCRVSGINAIEVSRIVDAVFWSEGGYATSHPYGVESVHVRNIREARRVCENTVINTYSRLMLSTRVGESRLPHDIHTSTCVFNARIFIPLLADRYCPVKADAVGNAR